MRWLHIRLPSLPVALHLHGAREGYLRGLRKPESALPQEKEKKYLLKSPWKVIRKATPEDLDQLHRNEQLEKDALGECSLRGGVAYQNRQRL
jgi:hypothetical protein